MIASVAHTYAAIADEFSRTRYNHWNKVKQFIESLDKYTILLDCGCGNGKYTNVRSDLVYIGCDITNELLQHANTAKSGDSMKDLFQVSCEKLPLRTNSAGAVICIAVLHHIASFEARVNVVIGLLKSLEPDGLAMITVWAYEQTNTKKRDTKWERVSPFTTDYLIPWRGANLRFYHLFTHTEVEELCKSVCMQMPDSAFALSYSIEFELDNWVITWKKKLINK